MEEMVTVTSKGQVVLPSKIREELEIDKGTKMVVVVRKGMVVMKPLKRLTELRGILMDVKKSAEELVKEVRVEWEKKLRDLA